MSTDRETTRLVRSWLEEGVTRLPDRVLDLVLDQVPTTPQRRSWWPTRRFDPMNTYVKLVAVAAAVVLVAVVGYQFLPGNGGIGGQPTIAPSPSPSLLASGSFTSHGVSAQLDAWGAGDSVTGTLTVRDSGLRATVDLECSRSTGGLLIIGGLVSDSTFDNSFIDGRRVAIIFQPGSPVKAVWWIALVEEAPVATCQELVEDSIIPEEAVGGLEPIVGTVLLGP